MQVTFTATSARELHEQIVSFSKEFGISSEGSRQQVLNLAGAAAPVRIEGAPAGTPAAAEETAKRTRRTKAQIEADEAAAKAAAPAAANTDFTSDPAPAAVAPVSNQPAGAASIAAAVSPSIVATPQQKQQVTEALTSVNGKFGLPVARGLLMKFGTDRLSSLEATKYPDFLALCERIKGCPTAADAQQLLA